MMHWCYDCKKSSKDVRSRQCEYFLCDACQQARDANDKKASLSRPSCTMNNATKPLTVAQAATAVCESQSNQLKKMTSKELSELMTKEILLLNNVRTSMSAILPESANLVEIANKAVDVKNIIKQHAAKRIEELATEDINISQCILLTPPRPASNSNVKRTPHLTTPAAIATVPVPEPSQPADCTQVTASKITCVDGCQLDHTEKRKPLECAMCQEHFHKVCVGLRSSAKPSLWICPSCKDIPKTIRLLVRKAEIQEKEIVHLQNENATLSQLANEQRLIVTELQESLKQKTDNALTDTPTPTPSQVKITATDIIKEPTSDNSTTTLIIGDSIIKDIHEAGLDNTTVQCLRGARITDIEESLQNMKPETFSTIIIHGGTNDCTTDDNIEVAAKSYTDMIDSIHESAPATTVYISTICPRTDNAKHQERVDKLNKNLKEIADKASCGVIDNDTNFRLRNDQPDSNSLNRSGLHLSKSGTRKLVKNLNAVHAILKKPVRNIDSAKESPVDSTHTHSSDTRRQNHGNNSNNRSRGCYNCGEQNHVKKNCRHGKPIKCHTCGKVGHKQKMCK